MRKSLFIRYTAVCIAIIIASTLFIGSMIMVFMVEFFKDYEYQLLEANMQRVVDISKEAMKTEEVTHNASYAIVLSTVYERYFSNEIHLVICNRDGNVYYQGPSEYAGDYKAITHMPNEYIQYIDENGMFRQTGNLDGALDSNYYIIGYDVNDKPESPNIYMFMAVSVDGFNTVLANIINKFVLAAVLAMCLSFIVLFIITFYLVRPLKLMVHNAKEYGKGNFIPKSHINTGDEIGELAKAMDSMSNSLAQIEESRRSFVANVSHELKTPMTTISGFVDGMMDGTIPEKDYNQYLSIVSNEVKRLSRLVKAMLNLSKIESGNLEIKISPLNLVDVIGKVLISFCDKIDEKHLEIRGLEVGDAWIDGDEGLIHQAFYNLIENAIKFVNDGGYIEFDFVHIGSLIEVRIRNSGDGLKDDEIDKLFNRFYKTDKSRSNDTTGVGLGLNIVKTIVNLHNGEIAVKSVYDEYTELAVTLKASKQNPRERKTQH